jgi:hypothetical protein
VNKNYYQKILVLLLAAGMLAAGLAAGQRYKIETNYRSVELAMPYDELQSLARQTGKSRPEVMQALREHGLTTVLFKEPAAGEISNYGDFAIMSGQEALAASRLGGQPSGWLYEALKNEEIKPEDTYFFTDQEAGARQLEEQLKVKTGNVEVYQYNEYFIIRTTADYNTLKNTGLGFPVAPLEESARCGLFAIVQLRNWPGVTPEGLARVFAPLKKIPNLSAIAFNDPSVPGYPNLLPQLAKEIRSLGVPLVQIEFFFQKGLPKLGLLLDKHVVRLHGIKSEEMLKYETADLKSRFLLAAGERNIRVLLIRPLISYKTGDPLQENLQFIAGLKKDLQKQGLAVGNASFLPPLPVSRLSLFFMGLGVISGGLLLLHRLGLRQGGWLLGLLAAMVWAGLLGIALDPARKLMALAAVIIFPTLSLTVNIRSHKASVEKSIAMLLRTSLYSLVGALFTMGLLADSAYLLKLNQFMGVKVAHVLPLLLVGGVFYIFSGPPLSGKQEPSLLARLSGFLNQPVLVKWALVAVVLSAMLAVYIIRTGNEVVMAPSTLELKTRTLLDNILGVRPRTKEFLLGHPLLLLLFYTGYRDNRYLPLLLLGTVGQISLVNTFAHIHTPLLISLLRLFNGLWLGILSGLVLILAWKLALHWWDRRLDEKTSYNK